MPVEMDLAELAENGDAVGPRTTRELEAVYDIPVTVSAVLGKSTMQVSQLLKLGRGAVVELDRKLGEAITTLPEEQASLLKLAFYEGKSHSVIAAEVGLPLGTVKSRLRLALARLRTYLGDER